MIGPDGSIYVSESYSAQFIDEPIAFDAVGRISKFTPDGSSSEPGSYGYGPSQFRGPHSMAFDSKNRSSWRTAATAASRFDQRANCSTPGISSAASAAFTSRLMTRSTPSTPSQTTNQSRWR